MPEETSQRTGNLIPNPAFETGVTGGIPVGWDVRSPYDSLRPVFALARKDGRQTLLAAGGGNPDCIGWLATGFPIVGRRTYRMWVRFRISAGVDPNRSLIFSVYEQGEKSRFNNGIFMFRRLDDGWIEGENRFFVPLEGPLDAEARIYFRYSASGRAWIDEIGLEECDALPERKVRVMATAGSGDLDAWSAVLDEAGKADVDLVLLPETFNGLKPEPLDGPSASLMSSKARQHSMYVCGTFHYNDPVDGREHNAFALYDRAGKLVGMYYKNHPYSPEAFAGVTPGTDVPVFTADFGKVGAIICYDSWFTDVAQLLALKGAEILMLPAAGCYMSLMHARSADNCVRVVVSTQNCGVGIYDTTGAEVRNPNLDSTRHAQSEPGFGDVVESNVGEIQTLSALLDLNHNVSPHNWGGPMLSAPGGRRNRSDQKQHLWDEIKREYERWWEPEQ